MWPFRRNMRRAQPYAAAPVHRAGPAAWRGAGAAADVQPVAATIDPTSSTTSPRGPTRRSSPRSGTTSSGGAGGHGARPRGPAPRTFAPAPGGPSHGSPTSRPAPSDDLRRPTRVAAGRQPPSDPRHAPDAERPIVSAHDVSDVAAPGSSPPVRPVVQPRASQPRPPLTRAAPPATIAARRVQRAVRAGAGAEAPRFRQTPVPAPDPPRSPSPAYSGRWTRRRPSPRSRTRVADARRPPTAGRVTGPAVASGASRGARPRTERRSIRDPAGPRQRPRGSVSRADRRPAARPPDAAGRRPALHRCQIRRLFARRHWLASFGAEFARNDRSAGRSRSARRRSLGRWSEAGPTTPVPIPVGIDESGRSAPVPPRRGRRRRSARHDAGGTPRRRAIGGRRPIGPARRARLAAPSQRSRRVEPQRRRPARPLRRSRPIGRHRVCARTSRRRVRRSPDGRRRVRRSTPRPRRRRREVRHAPDPGRRRRPPPCHGR